MLNSVELIGRVTKDIEVRKTKNGKSVVSFTLAIDKGKDVKADFIECQAWEGRADTIAKYVRKGDMFHVAGEIVNNNYENNGVKVYSYVVNVTGFTLLPNKREEAKKEEAEAEQLNGNGNIEINSDELPFY